MKRIYPVCYLAVMLAPAVMAAGTEYNPQMSLILDGRYSDYSNDPVSYTLPGFQPGEEAGLNSAGFSIGESELVLSSNIDSYFSGKATFAFAEDGASVEEAFIESLAIGHGINLKFGRFLSSFGYLNSRHAHLWDFADAPLIYRALFGDTFRDDGVQINYLLPTDLFMQISAEFLSGNTFPAGGNIDGGVGASTVSFTLGGDVGTDHAWQTGLSHWQANNIGERLDAYDNSFSGDSKMDALHVVYKWSPDGNPLQQNFKFQMEYFERTEDGVMTDDISSNTSTYMGDQKGWYAQAVYQFIPRWRTGIRIDQVSADNTGDNITVLTDIGLITDGHDTQRASAMIEWLPSEYSRLRLQFNSDQSAADITDKQIFMQYTFSLGAHGAHQF
ncbi:MAG TPA: hypothetical protein VFY78_03175 [Gammaproteobacteria bacterium]|nr:hypothetical protein [Gammaproteobacteria bacterium]